MAFLAGGFSRPSQCGAPRLTNHILYPDHKQAYRGPVFRFDTSRLTGGADLGRLYHRYVLYDYLPSYVQDKEWIPGR